MSLYAFTPESATVYWLSPDHQEDMIDNHYAVEMIEEVKIEAPKVDAPKMEIKTVTETKSWPCSTKPKNLSEKVHEGCNYATVETVSEPVIAAPKKEMTWEDYKAELDEWLSHKNKQEWKPKKVSWEPIMSLIKKTGHCGNLFESPEQAQKVIILFMAVIFGFILGRSW